MAEREPAREELRVKNRGGARRIGPICFGTPMPLTPGETLWLLRRRSGAPAHFTARLFRVSDHVYRAWERGRLPAMVTLELVGALTDGEACALYRRRRHWAQWEAAAWLGVSRVAVVLAERDRHRVSAFAMRRVYEADHG